MHPILIDTYFNLASHPAARATEVVRASLSGAILSGQVIGDDVWKEILMLDIKLVADLLPPNWSPDKGIWEYALQSKNQPLINLLFTKYPDTFILSELDDTVFQDSKSFAYLPPIKSSNLGKEVRFRMTTAKLEWLAYNSPELFASIQDEFISEVICSAKLINLISLSKLRKWFIGNFNTRSTTNFTAILSRIIPELNAPKYANPEISIQLTQMGWSREGSKECVRIYIAHCPDEYMQWLKLQMTGGRYSFAGKEVTVAPTNIDSLKEHWMLVSDNAKLLTHVDLEVEMAVFSSAQARDIFTNNTYTWPAITHALKTGQLDGQRLITAYLASPSMARVTNELVLKVLDSMTHITFASNARISTRNIPLDVIKVCLEKASPKATLLAMIIKEGSTDSLRHILRHEDISSLIPRYLNIQECDQSDFHKLNPANLEALIPLSRAVPFKFNALIWQAAKPSIDLLKEAVAMDCPRFKIRYVKDADLAVLCKMAELARKPHATAFLRDVLVRRGIQELQAPLNNTNKT